LQPIASLVKGGIYLRNKPVINNTSTSYFYSKVSFSKELFIMVESLTTVALLAVIVEVATNGLKAAFPFIKGKQKNGSRITSAVVGTALCLTTHIGILQNMNIEVSHPVLDYVITGIIISRGSNAVHDIISVFNERKEKIA